MDIIQDFGGIMKTVGIIAEFNPFHNGHKYIIEEAKRITGADRCVIAMSGDFVQRGAPAVCDKYLRTKMALTCGADAVFEIPASYATGSAEIFAEAGVKLFATLGNVDFIVFGSECADTDKLNRIAGILVEESDTFKENLQSGLKQGLSFPAAREAAFEKETGDPELTALLRSPNNILGIEYCKAVLRLKKSGFAGTVPESVAAERIGSGYHDKTIVRHEYASATAIRAALEDPDGSYAAVLEQVPEEILPVYKENYRRSMPVCLDDFSNMLYLRLNSVPEDEFTSFADISPDLANTLKKYKNEPITFNELINRLKSKNNNYSAISRALLHLTLGIPASHIDTLKSSNTLPYVRLLGFRRESSDIMHAISNNPDCSLITKLADADRTQPLLAADIYASGCYRQIMHSVFNNDPGSEFTQSPVIV